MHRYEHEYIFTIMSMWACSLLPSNQSLFISKLSATCTGWKWMVMGRLIMKGVLVTCVYLPKGTNKLILVVIVTYLNCMCEYNMYMHLYIVCEYKSTDMCINVGSVPHLQSHSL